MLRLIVETESFEIDFKHARDSSRRLLERLSPAKIELACQCRK